MHFLGEKVRILEELERDSRSEGPRAMNLMARKGHANDLACCYALHKSLGLPYPEARWRILPAMWRHLLPTSAFTWRSIIPRANCPY